ncbi:lipocalin-like domain-containing protein [Rufibacter roseus]|uniref:Lipocalin family protein n=1 Tax=Rufibacter roseus TaxID=1567108 RepID=A0ABW2DFB0_9BACT|nr:lipocalin family protein [Rufibacter roseus]
MKNLITSFFAVMLLCLSACSNDDDNQLDAQAKLPNKRWAITELKIETFLGESDAYADFEDCEKDNYFEFRENGVLIVDEGATKCSSDDPQQTQGTWSVQGNVMTISGLNLGLPSNTVKLNITELTDASLRGTFKEDYQGVPVSGKLAMRAQ